MEHLTLEEIEAFVADEPGTDADRVRAHVRGCPECADALAREARLDGALRDVAERLGRARRPVPAPGASRRASRPRRVLAIAAGLLAISAATVLLAQRSRAPGGPASPAAPIVLTGDTPGMRAGLEPDPGLGPMLPAQAEARSLVSQPGMPASFEPL